MKTIVHRLLLGLLLLTVISTYAAGAPRGRGGTIDQTVNFLTMYGYLPQSDMETGNLRTDDQLKEAIRQMQRFGNIPETGIVDAPTLALMTRRRCGNPDVDPDAARGRRHKRYALQGNKWTKTDLTWSISQWPTGMDRATVRQETGKALRIWSDASKLSFTEVSSQDEADVVVAFNRGYHGDGYPFDGPGAVLAHAFFPGDGRGGDTHFDDEETWIVSTRSNDDGVSLLAVAAHEFGHSLGLAHSSVPEALMYPYYQGIKESLELPYDDRMGIQQLYGALDERPWAPLSPTDPKPPQRQPSTPPPPLPTVSLPASKPRGSHDDREGDIGARATSPVPEAPEPPKTPVDGKPDTCDTHYDAISVIRRELFIFKGLYFWRLDSVGLMKDYPVEISRFWYELPTDVKHIDAVYERLKDKKIVFFIGKLFWLFDANRPMPGFPKPLTAIGIPEDVEKIDAALVWGHNSKTYLFSGTMYWRFDEDEQRVELDYPRDISIWRGVPCDIDAAFQWTDGHTYFFKDKGFWKFNDKRMRVENKHATAAAQTWMKCPHGDPRKENELPHHHKPKKHSGGEDHHGKDHEGGREEAVTSRAGASVLSIRCLVLCVAVIVKGFGVTA